MLMKPNTISAKAKRLSSIESISNAIPNDR